MPRLNSVSGTLRAIVAAIAANSVCRPVRAASIVAVPLRTDVPVKTALPRWPIWAARSAASLAGGSWSAAA